MFYFLNLHHLRKISIVPLWNKKKHKTSVDGQTFKSLWIQTLLKSQISTIVD
nr:MAG TPA_asm: hypothetical protein [Caudoviricetes sp.]